MSKVLFGAAQAQHLKWQSTLPGKLDTILEKLDIAGDLKDKRVCVKMHLGGNVGYTTVHPVFVRRLITFIKASGGKPFVTDSNHSALTAFERGYTQETIGCPIVPAAGASDKYYHTFPAPYKNLKELHVAGEIVDADYLIVLSHAKAHGNSGYGGAIKNLALGAMNAVSRNALHMAQHSESYWDADKCTHYTDGCELCITNCKLNAMRFADDKTLHVGFHECNFCYECNTVCPHGAVSVREVFAADFQEVMAIGTKIVMNHFDEKSRAFINLATNVTPFCDCWGFSTPSLVPDIGLFASKDMIAVETATLDSIKTENLIPGSIPPWLTLRPEVEGHLFKKIHGKDPYLHVTACERLGLGTSAYEIEEVE